MPVGKFARTAAVLLGLAEAAVVLCALPSSAQVLDERFPFLEDRARRNRQWQQQPWQQPNQFGDPTQPPPQQHRQAAPPVDPTRPPPPRRPDVAPTVNVAVFGDSLAEWLAAGLDEAFAETPEIGIMRKARALTGLIRVEVRNEAYDWPQQIKEILAADKPDYVVMMIGIGDRRGIREALPARAPARQARPNQPAQPGTPATAGVPPQPAQAAAPKPADPEAPPQQDAPKPDEQPSIVQEAPSAGSTVHEFRSEKWGELYGKRIDETVAALKSRGVPVFWVGLPSIRGTRATSDMVYLNDLFRSRAEKAGITYIDIWDGFVDDAGNYSNYGADFEGQTRRLRTGDGVHFTRAGARKLAHYAEREIRRLLASRGTPTATPLPQEPEPDIKAPPTAAAPGLPPRPSASPVMSLTAPAGTGETLLGGGPANSGATDSIVQRVLVRGEPVEAPPGRADDFAWPRRDVVTATGVLPPDPLAPPPPTVAAPAAPAATRPLAAAPRPARTQPDGGWRPFAQRPYEQPRRWDNSPSFFDWFRR